MGTILGAPLIRIIAFGGLYWGPLILGNYHVASSYPRSARRAPTAIGKWPCFGGSLEGITNIHIIHISNIINIINIHINNINMNNIHINTIMLFWATGRFGSFQQISEE